MKPQLIEQLETRRLLAVSVTGSILRISGTDGNDRIFVDSRPGFSTGNSVHYSVLVHVNDQTTDVSNIPLNKIIIDGGAGNDTVLIPRVLTTVQTRRVGSNQQSVEHRISAYAIVNGGAGDDTIVGGRRNDTLSGGDGNDVIFAGDGNDIVFGGAGNDNLNGQSGNDRLFGDSGNDNLIGETGANMFSGGEGADTADYSARTDNLVITMTNSLDESPASGSDRILRDVETINGGSGNDSISGNFFNNVINGGAGNDSLNGMEGNDIVNGGPGDDLFISTDRYQETTFDDNGTPNLIAGGQIFRGRDILIGGGGNDRAIVDNKDATRDIETVENE